MSAGKSVAAAALCAAVLLGNGPTASAQTTALQSEAGQTDALAVQHGTMRVQTRIAGEFSSFAGSDANAQSLVTGLRSGTTIELQSVSGGGAASTLTFDPPTRPMGHGNVYISLALARQQLAGYGITDPTPQEIQAALTGGTITTGSGATAQSVTLQGVLVQRADGMGWGQIARSQGMNLGQTVSGLRSANAGIAAGGSAASGITTAVGTTVPAGTATGSLQRGNSAQAPGHQRGIVTATGAGVGGGTAAAAQTGAGTGRGGIVTGAGASAAARGNSNAQGQAKGLFRQ